MGLGLFFTAVPGTVTRFQTGPAQFVSGDRDCGDFATRWETQWFYWQAGSGDPHHLDDDGDGLACEFNPWFDLSGWFGR